MPAQPEFVVRIVSIDYYLTRPTIGVDLCYSHLEGTTIEQVPVIRIFGATPTGQKTCLHLHKAFPYFYVAYQEALPSDAAAVQAYLRRMAQSIEAAMRGAAAPGAPRRQHVYSVQLVRGRAFYGYHADEQLFIKIILFNPMEVGKVAALMQNGAVLGRSFQPHEAHVPYLLQLKVDFNLYGMGYMRMKRVLFRGSVPEHHQRERTGWRAKPVVVQFEDGSIGSQEFGPSPHVPLGAAQSDLPASQQPPAYWTASTVPSDWLWERAGAGARVPEKLSCCELEVDACVEDILNRQELVRVPLDDAPDELRLVESLAPMWDEERQRSGSQMPCAPASPPRHPKPLCEAVDFVRSQFQRIADQHRAETGSPASQPAAPGAGSSPSQPSQAGSGTQSIPEAILRCTQPANIATATNAAQPPPGPAAEPSPLPDVQDPAVSGSAGGAAHLTEADAVHGGPSQHAAAHASQQDPAQPLQELDPHVREVMEWMQQHADSDREEEEDYLMLLANQAITQRGEASQGVTQQDMLQRAQAAATSLASQSQHEVEAILECSQPVQPDYDDGQEEVTSPAGLEPPSSGSIRDMEDLAFPAGQGAMAQRSTAQGSAAPISALQGGAGQPNRVVRVLEQRFGSAQDAAQPAGGSAMEVDEPAEQQSLPNNPLQPGPVHRPDPAAAHGGNHAQFLAAPAEANATAHVSFPAQPAHFAMAPGLNDGFQGLPVLSVDDQHHNVAANNVAVPHSPHPQLRPAARRSSTGQAYAQLPLQRTSPNQPHLAYPPLPFQQSPHHSAYHPAAYHPPCQQQQQPSLMRPTGVFDATEWASLVGDSDMPAGLGPHPSLAEAGPNDSHMLDAGATAAPPSHPDAADLEHAGSGTGQSVSALSGDPHAPQPAIDAQHMAWPGHPSALLHAGSGSSHIPQLDGAGNTSSACAAACGVPAKMCSSREEESVHAAWGRVYQETWGALPAGPELSLGRDDGLPCMSGRKQVSNFRRRLRLQRRLLGSASPASAQPSIGSDSDAGAQQLLPQVDGAGGTRKPARRGKDAPLQTRSAAAWPPQQAQHTQQHDAPPAAAGIEVEAAAGPAPASPSRHSQGGSARYGALPIRASQGSPPAGSRPRQAVTAPGRPDGPSRSLNSNAGSHPTHSDGPTSARRPANGNARTGRSRGHLAASAREASSARAAQAGAASHPKANSAAKRQGLARGAAQARGGDGNAGQLLVGQRPLTFHRGHFASGLRRPLASRGLSNLTAGPPKAVSQPSEQHQDANDRSAAAQLPPTASAAGAQPEPAQLHPQPQLHLLNEAEGTQQVMQPPSHPEQRPLASAHSHIVAPGLQEAATFQRRRSRDAVRDTDAKAYAAMLALQQHDSESEGATPALDTAHSSPLEAVQQLPAAPLVSKSHSDPQLQARRAGAASAQQPAAELEQPRTRRLRHVVQRTTSQVLPAKPAVPPDDSSDCDAPGSLEPAHSSPLEPLQRLAAEPLPTRSHSDPQQQSRLKFEASRVDGQPAAQAARPSRLRRCREAVRQTDAKAYAAILALTHHDADLGSEIEAAPGSKHSRKHGSGGSPKRRIQQPAGQAAGQAGTLQIAQHAEAIKQAEDAVRTENATGTAAAPLHPANPSAGPACNQAAAATPPAAAGLQLCAGQGKQAVADASAAAVAQTPEPGCAGRAADHSDMELDDIEIVLDSQPTPVKSPASGGNGRHAVPTTAGSAEDAEAAAAGPAQATEAQLLAQPGRQHYGMPAAAGAQSVPHQWSGEQSWGVVPDSEPSSADAGHCPVQPAVNQAAADAGRMPNKPGVLSQSATGAQAALSSDVLAAVTTEAAEAALASAIHGNMLSTPLPKPALSASVVPFDTAQTMPVPVQPGVPAGPAHLEVASTPVHSQAHTPHNDIVPDSQPDDSPGVCPGGLADAADMQQKAGVSIVETEAAGLADQQAAADNAAAASCAAAAAAPISQQRWVPQLSQETSCGHPASFRAAGRTPNHAGNCAEPGPTAVDMPMGQAAETRTGSAVQAVAETAAAPALDSPFRTPAPRLLPHSTHRPSMPPPHTVEPDARAHQRTGPIGGPRRVALAFDAEAAAQVAGLRHPSGGQMDGVGATQEAMDLSFPAAAQLATPAAMPSPALSDMPTIRLGQRQLDSPFGFSPQLMQPQQQQQQRPSLSVLPTPTGLGSIRLGQAQGDSPVCVRQHASGQGHAADGPASVVDSAWPSEPTSRPGPQQQRSPDSVGWLSAAREPAHQQRDGDKPGHQGSGQDDRVVHVFKGRHPPPSQEELDASMTNHGLLRINHPQAFYGNAADVPHRATIFAGQVFHVPTSATGNLSPFRGGNATAGPFGTARLAVLLRSLQSNGQQLCRADGQPDYPALADSEHMPGDGQGREQRPVYVMVPARPAPSPPHIDAWLTARRGRAAAAANASLESKAGRGSGFTMDANTGKLVPLYTDSQASEEGQGGSLLGTPGLCTAPNATPRDASQPEVQQTPAQQEEEEVRPASPKYDERNFFYTTPRTRTPVVSTAALAAVASSQQGAPPVRRHSQATPNLARVAAENRAHASQTGAPPQQPGGQTPQPMPGKGDGDRLGPGGKAGSPSTSRKRVAFDDKGSEATAGQAAAVEGPASSFKGSLSSAKRRKFVSQITPPSPAAGASGPTPLSQAGFKRLVAGKGQQLTLLSVEVHADCRGSLLPDPRYDAVRCIILTVMDDNEAVADNLYTARVLLFQDPLPKAASPAGPAGLAAPATADPAGSAAGSADGAGAATHDGLPDIQTEVHPKEEALLEAFVAAVQALDPDIVLGFEVQKGSLGYLADRAATMDKPLLRQISRLPETFSMKEKQHDEYGTLHASGIHVTGRIVLNLWRILRSELKLNIYTFESCVAAVLQLRTPHVPSSVLAQWFKGGPGGGRWRCIRYWVTRARLNLAMMEQLDLVGRTGEMARAFGIDFFSVLTRGSQYRVESMLLRLAHTQNYLLLSASKEQVAQQPAMECIPLVMEPESRFYTSPVVVLDFQSLYPSMIIAYNLCYSTCVGRPAHSSNTGESVKLGAASLLLPKGSLAGPMAPDRLIVAPNGVAYVAPEARKGVVPRLLREILETRIMVKAAMKRAPASAKVLQRVLNARQFSLKLIANVTYGYAAAGFSGRMPMAELADSIVQSGRQTLENAIRMVEANQEWKARVVYGDTDSMFVLLPGRSREEAHKIGAEIASAVTAANPPPVTLKMEKVYHPCVLLSKKRYVGAMYEAPGQTVPDFDAKGIETVRRDTCPAVAKMMERSLRLLFNTRDLSEVKSYLERQWSKILANRISIQDFIFAKEVRLGTYSPKAPVVPPAAIVAGKAMAADPRAEPRFGERVPYIVVYGEPGARLVDMVVSPHALVESQGRLRLHSIYYITKAIIPALERVFSLMGADLRQWFAALPRPSKLLPQKRPAAALPLAAGGRTTGAGTIDQYYLSRHCAVCDGLTHAAKPLCQACRAAPQFAAAVLTARSARLESQHVHLVRVCLHCSSGGGRNLSEGGVACDSLDCGVFFERRKVSHELAAALALRTAGLQLLQP